MKNNATRTIPAIQIPHKTVFKIVLDEAIVDEKSFNTKTGAAGVPVVFPAKVEG